MMFKSGTSKCSIFIVNMKHSVEIAGFSESDKYYPFTDESDITIGSLEAVVSSLLQNMFYVFF